MNKLALVLFFCYSISFGQNQVAIDSLKKIISTKKTNDTVISKTYYELIKHFKRINKDSCLYYMSALKDYSNKKQSNLGYYYYYKLKAAYFNFYTNENENALDFISENLFKSLEASEKLSNPELISITYSRLGEEHSRLGNFNDGIKYFQKSIEIANKHDIWIESAYSYTLMAENYLKSFSETSKALTYLLKADSIYVANHYDGEDQGFNLSIIGDVYKELGEYGKAEVYQKRALEVFKNHKNKYQEIGIMGALASLEKTKKNYPKSISILKECIAYFKENNFPIKEAGFRQGLSETYLEANQLSEALEQANISLDIRKSNEDAFGVLIGTISKAKILFELKEYQKSYDLALEGYTLAKDMESLYDIEESLGILYKSSEKLNDFEKAYRYALEHKVAKDSLESKKNLNKVKEIEARYQSEKKEQEIALLTAQNEVTTKQKENQRNLLLAGLGITTIAGIFFFYLYRNRQKTNQKLKELDALKSNFFANISHEFRTPLTLISGPIEKQLKNPQLKQDDRKDFEMVQRNSKRLLDLVNQLLDLSKLEAGNLTLQVKEGDLSLLLKSLTASFDYQAELKDINYLVEIEEAEQAWFDADAIEKITTNLLFNSFKYVLPQGKISFKSTMHTEFVEILIENDGEISGTDTIEEIFNRFYQSDTSTEGVGIGLALVKELVILYKGTITAENTKYKTVLFTVHLPINKHQFSEDELMNEAHETISDTKVSTTETFHLKGQYISKIDEDSPILLVVEDNEDIRSFVKAAFEQEYRVIEAEDGSEGVQLAQELIPDIIISDVMMPKLNGFELTSVLKQDERTSHIPIILLTAKVEDADQYKGLETGADDYILKPFKTKILTTRVKNLVASRNKLRDRYSQEVVLRPKDISITKFDEKFIEKIQNVLDNKLTDSSFSIEEFSAAVGMSRMQLHRKLKALMGLSASEFIRSQRLKLAADLLKQSDANVSEIAYSVGFNEPSYFTKCFKEAFGCLPSEYSQE